MNSISEGRTQKYLRSMLLTCVEIAETQTSYRVHEIIFIAILIVQHCQVLSNTSQFSGFDNVILEVLDTVVHIFSIYYLFKYIDTQLAIWIMFISINLILWTIMGLIFWLSYIRYKEQQTKFKKNAFLQFLKEIINTFFTIYIFLLFGPISKMNMATMISGKNSLIVAERQEEPGLLMSYNLFVGSLGLLLNFTITFISIYFFRNYEYGGQNILKRKYSFAAIGNLLVRLCFIISDLVGVEYTVKYVLGNIYGMFAIYDSFFVRPFENMTIACSFSIITINYELFQILLPMLRLGHLQAQSFIYMVVWIGPLLSQIAITHFQHVRIETLHYIEKSVSEDYEQFSLFSEQVFQLYSLSSKNDDAKILLHQLFRYHVLHCNSMDCFAQEIDRKGYPNQSYTQELLIKLIDQMFKVTISDPQVLKDSSTYEKISLKYISFIQKYVENNLLSFLFLKNLAKNKESMSYYFSLLFEIQSDKIQESIRQKIQIMQGADQKQDGSTNFVEEIQEIEVNSQNFTNYLQKIMILRFDIWTQLNHQSNTMDELLDRIISKLKRLLKLRIDLLTYFDHVFGVDHVNTLRNNIAYQKLQQLYWLFVMNDTIEVARLESVINDMRRRDQYKDELYLNNSNYMKGDSVIIQIGLSIDVGKILNKQNLKIPAFFGMTINDWEPIQYLDDLVPSFVQDLHNYILAQFFHIGYSNVMQVNKKIFLQNKSNFLFPATLRLCNDFITLDDCVFNVNLLKVASNREVIIFDESGKIFGSSKHLMDILTTSSLKSLQNHYIQLLSPSILSIFEQFQSELMQNQTIEHIFIENQVQNLSAQLLIGRDYLDLNQQYAQFQGSQKLQLSTKDDRIKIHQFITDQKQRFLDDCLEKKVKIKFSLHSIYRSFHSIDEKILDQFVGLEPQIETKKLRYYQIECFEIIRQSIKHNLQQSVRNVTLTINSNNLTGRDRFSDYESSIEDQQPPNLSENLDVQRDILQINYQEERLAYQQEGQIDDANFGLESTNRVYNLNSPISIKSSEALINNQGLVEIDNSKRSFLMKMFNHHQQAVMKVSPNLQNRKEFLDQEFEENWPKELDGSIVQKNSNIQLNQVQSRVELNDNYDLSNLAGSDNEDEELDKQSGKKQKKDEAVKNQRRHQQQEIMSSQNSKSTSGNISASNFFLERKMPRKYIFFILITYSLFLVIIVCTLIQIVISINGFQTIGSFNKQVDTGYTLQSSYVKSVMGVILQFLQNQKALTRNFSIPFDQDKLFKKFQNDGAIQFIDLIQTRFELVRLTQNQIKSLDVITFYDRIAEHINSLTVVVNNDVFYSLIQGLSPNNDVTTQMQKVIQNQLSMLQQQLLDNLFLVFYISLTLVLILIMLQFKTYCTFLKFQEKILLIITRISQQDYEKELEKIDYAKNLLKMQKGSFIITNDVINQYIYFKSGNAKTEADVDVLKTENRTSKKKLKKDLDFQNKKQGAGQILSSKIYNPILSVKTHLLQYSLLASAVVAFLVGVIAFALQTPQQCSLISNYYLDYSRLFSTIQQVMIWTEIKAVQPYLFHSPAEIGQKDYHSFEQQYNKWLSEIQYQTSQEQILNVNYQNNQEILDLLYSDMCQVKDFYNNHQSFQLLCKSMFKDYYKTGITGFIKKLMILFYSYQIQIDTQTFTSNEQASAFMRLPENWALLILFPDSFGPAIDSALSLIQGQLISVTDQLGINLLIYLIVSGMVTNLLLIVYYHFHVQDLNQRIQSLEYLLTMVPFEILQEQTINQMIKQITNY